MNGFDRAASRIVLGAIAPVSLMLAGWWGSLGLFGAGPWIAPSALGGVAIGLALDLTVLGTWLGSLFAQRMPALIAVGIFYSAIIYVLFMGFPVMNLSVGIAGGYVVGRRAALVPGSRFQALHEARLVARVASLPRRSRGAPESNGIGAPSRPSPSPTAVCGPPCPGRQARRNVGMCRRLRPRPGEPA